MKLLIQLCKTLFSRPPTLWQILLIISFVFWTIATLRPDSPLQELMALLGLITLLYAVWIGLSKWNLRYLGIDLKPVIIWFLFCLIISRTIDRFPQKVLWVTYPEVIALTQILPDVMKMRSLDLSLREGRQLLQRNFLLLLSSLLISCWIYWYFVIDEWIIANPELLNEDMEKSLFVIKLDLEILRSLSD